MRTRTSSGMLLDQKLKLVEETILKRQDPVTGLISNNYEDFPGLLHLKNKYRLFF
jgi:hypothetical protein